MTFSLKKEAKVGATAYFRSGGSAVMDSVEDSNCSEYPVGIYFKGYEYTREYYAENGRYRCSGKNLLDIIRIEPTPFDWNDVKQGMAFKDMKYGDIVFFVANDFARKHEIVVSEYENCVHLFSVEKSELIRTPEHDLDLEEG